MGDISKNLSRWEFACGCGCGFDTADYALVNVLQSCVNYFEHKYKRDIRIDITGPNRCREYNDSLRALFVSSENR